MFTLCNGGRGGGARVSQVNAASQRISNSLRFYRDPRRDKWQNIETGLTGASRLIAERVATLERRE